MLDQHTSFWYLLVCGSGKQQQIPIRILDDEILGAPRLLFQLLVKGNTSGLKFKKQAQQSSPTGLRTHQD
jgi:hypothetical protein